MSKLNGKKIFISAGEASGDMYGANLARALQAHTPDVQLFGMGGVQMQAAGVDVRVNSSDISVVGVFEVFAHLKKILAAAKKLKNILKSEKPDLVILIDFPDFNLSLAKTAKKLNIKVMYYISPQVWAWRAGRVKTIKQRVDKMVVALPFEKPYYERAGVPVEFVGHPLIDIVKTDLTPDAVKQLYKIPSTQTPIIGLLPGSRHHEVQRHLPILLNSAQQLQKTFPNAHFVIPKAPSIAREELDVHLAKISGLPVTVIERDTYHALQACDVALIVSGTITLEAALLNVPMVILYKMKKLSHFLAIRLVKAPFFGLCNIVAEQKIVPELLQAEANPEKIAQMASDMLTNPALTQVTKNQMAQLRHRLGEPGVNSRIVNVIEKIF